MNECYNVCLSIQSKGRFEVNITGSGSATLSDIHTCAIALALYIRDPANWIPDTDKPYHFTRFLRNDHPIFGNLTGCAPQYISSNDHKLALYGSGWVCPLTVGAAYGAATPQVSAPLYTISLAVTIVFIAQMTVTCWR